MKGRTKYISSEDQSVIEFLYSIYHGHVEAGSWPTDDEGLTEEECQKNKELREKVARFREKFNT